MRLLLIACCAVAAAECPLPAVDGFSVFAVIDFAATVGAAGELFPEAFLDDLVELKQGFDNKGVAVPGEGIGSAPRTGECMDIFPLLELFQEGVDMGCADGFSELCFQLLHQLIAVPLSLLQGDEQVQLDEAIHLEHGRQRYRKAYIFYHFPIYQYLIYPDTMEKDPVCGMDNVYH